MSGNPRVHYNLGLAYRDMGRLDAADRELRHALELDPTNADFLFARADVCVRQGRLDEARRVTSLWLEHHPGDPRALEVQRALARSMAP